MTSMDTVKEFGKEHPLIMDILTDSITVETARNKLYQHFGFLEQQLLNHGDTISPLGRKHALSSIHVLKNIISVYNEEKSGFSALTLLWELARLPDGGHPPESSAFLAEIGHLFDTMTGNVQLEARLAEASENLPFSNDGYENRFLRLNDMAKQYSHWIEKNGYCSGLDEKTIRSVQVNRDMILNYFGASPEEWNDYTWHIRHLLTDADLINKLIKLSKEEYQCLILAQEQKIPFRITPFYLSLLSENKNRQTFGSTAALREQVLPDMGYIKEMIKNGGSTLEMDYMNETACSPVTMVTRRYPMVAIIKPTLWCPQLCMYCQRNWEMQNAERGEIPQFWKLLEEAMEWIRSNQNIREILITGGEFLSLSNQTIAYILDCIAKMGHIKRIRIGTRMLITLPMRFDEDLLEILADHSDKITIVTHLQSANEISPELQEVCRKIGRNGIRILNQQVYTIQNCRRFETVFLREQMFLLGIQPYYSFDLKGKKETYTFRVPIARILQERKEEARLFPGIIRTDHAVFNLPGIGKNDLTDGEDHEIIMILADGSRVYEFYSWDRYERGFDTYLYEDEPIYNFLEKMRERGEEPEDYGTIWNYY